MTNTQKSIISTRTILIGGVVIILLTCSALVLFLRRGTQGHASHRDRAAAEAAGMFAGFRANELSVLVPAGATSIEFQWDIDSNERWAAFTYPNEFETFITSRCTSGASRPAPSPGYGSWWLRGGRVDSRFLCGDHGAVILDRENRRAYVYLAPI